MPNIKSREADYIAGVDGQFQQKNVRFNYIIDMQYRILIVDSSDSARAVTSTVQEKRNQLFTLCVANGERNGNEKIFKWDKS